MSSPVSWLEERLGALQKLSQLHSTLREKRPEAARQTAVIVVEDGLKEIRQKMLKETAWLVERIGERPGINLAFVSHEGLVLAASGKYEDHEAYAAMANRFASEATETSRRLGLEPPNQVLLVANDRKLALIFVEEMILGIVSPSNIELATLLSKV